MCKERFVVENRQAKRAFCDKCQAIIDKQREEDAEKRRAEEESGTEEKEE